MSELNLEEIEARWDEATEGPWVFQPWSAHLLPSGDYAESILMANASSDGELCRGLFDADGEAIAHARTDVPDLIAEVRWLRQWKAEALGVIRDLQELGKALGLPVGTWITGEAAAEKALELRTQIERVRELHKPVPVYEPADVCKNDDERHVDERHAESECGEELCLDLQLEYSSCEACSNPYDELTAYPCATIRALDAPGGICDHGCEALTGLCIVDHKSLGGDGE